MLGLFWKCFNFAVYSKMEKNKSKSMISAYNWKGRVVLVAEDEEINYLFLGEVLNRTGAKVLWAKNGQEAIDLYNKMRLI
jgi:PleD family two-component response regulator